MDYFLKRWKRITNVRLVKFIVNLFQFNRTNWRAVLLCFLAAAVFWLFNAFNKTYSTNIRFPLSFEFDEQRYAQSAPLPSSINLNVSGNGWDLFRKHFGIKVPELVIPLERPLDVKKIVAPTLPPILASQIGALKINFVVSDTLHIQIDERDLHKYRLVVDASAIQFEKGLGIVSPIVISPDTISMEGPKKILHTLPDSIIVRLPSEKISETYQQEVEVKVEYGEFIKRNPPVVEVLFEVGPISIVEKKIRVITPAAVLPNSDSVLVRFEIPAQLKNEFESLAVITAHLEKRKNLLGDRFLPTLRGKPSYARVLQIDSVRFTQR